MRALAKTLQDQDANVREVIIWRLLQDMKSQFETPPEYISGLVQLLYYGVPYFRDHSMAGQALLSWTGSQGRAALIEALRSSDWSLRFGAAITYGGHLDQLSSYIKYRNNPDVGPFPEEEISPKEVISILAEGLTHPDWKTRESAASILYNISTDTQDESYLTSIHDEARKALEGSLPFGIIFQTVRDMDWIVHQDAVNSLNTDGITFKFSNSLPIYGPGIYGPGKITIQPVDGEPLGWNRKQSSHTLTITPPEGKELVRDQAYVIRLRDFRDVMGHQIDAEIAFTTAVPRY